MLDTISLVTFFCSVFTFIQCKLVIRNIFLLPLLTLSKSERASNQGIKLQVTTKDIKKGDRVYDKHCMTSTSNMFLVQC